MREAPPSQSKAITLFHQKDYETSFLQDVFSILMQGLRGDLICKNIFHKYSNKYFDQKQKKERKRKYFTDIQNNNLSDGRFQKHKLIMYSSQLHYKVAMIQGMENEDKRKMDAIILRILGTQQRHIDQSFEELVESKNLGCFLTS